MTSILKVLQIGPDPEVEDDDEPVKEDFMKKVFRYVDSITYTKVDLMTDDTEEKFYKSASFMINRALSQFPDCVMYANELNMYPAMEPKAQYRFLMNNIRAKKRFAKWPKKANHDVINHISDHYKFNRRKTELAIEVLGEEMVQAIIKKRQQKGGADGFVSGVRSRD